MCQSSLTIELGYQVKFITGQGGSLSAILTVLCLAFGCQAKGTLRATFLKNFIKNGCLCTWKFSKLIDLFLLEFFCHLEGPMVDQTRGSSEGALTSGL
ncbi:P-loop containing nucleoside triphosphate hydrolase protein [Dioscorea alata]|uniref:P-loop containing nucleoside triphosphate hydrolase protein n=1 Tax=Dioscorea alata TaxID=55571 RepID=A0ACB7WHY4_DIOAL|nr:P-loop containing nucleoside triphosphate hydrolase protein [Dioscorea alata]